MSDLLTLCDKLTARNPQESTSWDRALEIVLDEGGACFFIRSGRYPGACACGITDDADPDLKKELDAELATRGLRLFIIDEEDPDVSDGIEELERLSDLAMCGRRAHRRIITWPEGKTIRPLRKKKKKKNRRELGWE